MNSITLARSYDMRRQKSLENFLSLGFLKSVLEKTQVLGLKF